MIDVRLPWLNIDKRHDCAMDNGEAEHRKNITSIERDKDSECKPIYHC